MVHRTKSKRRAEGGEVLYSIRIVYFDEVVAYVVDEQRKDIEKESIVTFLNVFQVITLINWLI